MQFIFDVPTLAVTLHQNQISYRQALEEAKFRSMEPEASAQLVKVVDAAVPLLVYTGSNQPINVNFERLRCLVFMTIQTRFISQKKDFNILMLNQNTRSYETYRNFARIIKGLPQQGWRRLRRFYVLEHTVINRFLDYICLGELADQYRARLMPIDQYYHHQFGLTAYLEHLR